IPFLMEALRDSFWWFEREQSTRDLFTAIENMGGDVVEPLIEALGDREGTVRRFAAMILGKLRDPRAIEELGMTLYDLHHDVSQAAAEALAQFGADAVGVLSEALSHPEAGVRERAIHGLGLIRDERVVPLLIERLNDPDRVVKKQAIQSLGGLQAKRAVPALQQIAADRSDRELAVLAKAAIGKIS
ncbi:MAG: HEAT repeat domain-containing protein, partial [Anaerolineales bacterium]|nr:HEAT repeat domain-containing protein [Anaerolineales bacterium]